MRTFLLLVVGLSVAGGAEPKGPAVYPLTEKIEGKTYGEWSAEWWKWAVAIPKDKNPILDQTGKFAGESQTQAVWFLAGTFGNKAEREFTIPAERPLFVAMFNYVAGAEVKKRTAAEQQETIKALTAEAKEMVDRSNGLELKVNGQTLAEPTKWRVVSPVFETVGPVADQALHPSFAGKQISVADGYWVMLKPLPVGKHVIQVKSQLKPRAGEPAFNLDVTYKMTVVAKK